MIDFNFIQFIRTQWAYRGQTTSKQRCLTFINVYNVVSTLFDHDVPTV